MYSSSPEPMHVGSNPGSPVGSPLFSRQPSNTPTYAPSFLMGNSHQQNVSLMSGGKESPLGVMGQSKTRDQLHVTWNPELEQVRQMSNKSSLSTSVSSPGRRMAVTGPPLKSLNSITSPDRNMSPMTRLQSPLNSSVLDQSLNISSMTSSQIDPFRTQGEDFNPAEDVDPKWVTVFGFPPDAASYILQQFGQYGTIIDKELPPQCNWMHIKYESVLESRKALGKNTKVYGECIRIGVTPCIQKAENLCDKLFRNVPVIVSDKLMKNGVNIGLRGDQSMSLNQSINMSNNVFADQSSITSPKRFNQSSIINERRDLDVSVNGSGLTSPKKGMRSLTAAYEQAGNHFKVVPTPENPSTDQGMVSKAWGYVFGS